VASSLQFLKATSKFVRERAERELSVAITAYDQTQVSRSLQTFFNMDCLPEAVDSVLRSVSKVCIQKRKKKLFFDFSECLTSFFSYFFFFSISSFTFLFKYHSLQCVTDAVTSTLDARLIEREAEKKDINSGISGECS